MPVHGGRCLKAKAEGEFLRSESAQEQGCSALDNELDCLGRVQHTLSCCLCLFLLLHILTTNQGNKDGSSVTDIKGLKVQGEPCVWCAGG